jgi:hypothetical protein
VQRLPMALFAAHHYRRAASASLDREQINKSLHDLIVACNGIFSLFKNQRLQSYFWLWE